MPAVIFAMLVILVLAVVVIALVVIGMEGTGSRQHPEFADVLAKTARHLNGDADAPDGLLAFVGELDDMQVPDLKAVPARIREMRSAKSAASASSATLPDEQPDASSAASPWAASASETAESVDEPAEQQAQRPTITATVYSPVADDPGALTWTPPNPEAAIEMGTHEASLNPGELPTGSDTVVHRPVTPN